MKHAQIVTKNAGHSRPVLQGVMHQDGDCIVTDSHRLYVAKDMYEGTEKNVNPKTGELIEGNYPDVSRLIPDPLSATLSVTLEVDTLHKVMKLITQAVKVGSATDLMTFDVTEGLLSISTGANALAYCTYPAKDVPAETEDFKMTANAKYVTEALALMKDTGTREITFNFYGNMRPFTFTADNVIALVLPVRTF